MTAFTYGVIETMFSVESEKRTTYGIAVYANSATDGSATVLISISDISADRALIEELVNRCNRLQLSPLHLKDIISDFFSVDTRGTTACSKETQ